MIFIDKIFTKTTSNRVCFTGSFLCNGTQTKLDHNNCTDYEQFQSFSTYLLLSNSFQCQYSTIITALHRTGLIPNEYSFYVCNGSNKIISFRLLNDGYADCLFKDRLKLNHIDIVVPHHFSPIFADSSRFLAAGTDRAIITWAGDAIEHLLFGFRLQYYGAAQPKFQIDDIITKTNNMRRYRIVPIDYLKSLFQPETYQNVKNMS
ncbi:unnamed protein product [Adineta ricciae]|nr:unnamed protein product [Adineta ricciae]